MLTNNARVRVTVKVCLLLSVICQDYINSHGPVTDATDHSRIILCLVNAGFLLLVVGAAVPGAYGADFMTSTSADTSFTS